MSAATSSLARCTNSVIVEGEYAGDYVIKCQLCNHTFDHLLEKRDMGTYSHSCGKWVELWPNKFAKCVFTALHEGDCLGEVVTNHLPRKDYAAYVKSTA